MDKKKVLVIIGGQSTEHWVSRVSGSSVLRELDKNKYDITRLGIDLDGTWYLLAANIQDYSKDGWLEGATKVEGVFDLLKQHDVIFPVLHGSYGEDGTIQGLFEMAKVPYVGCRVLGSSVSMDKIYTKMVFERAGIPQTPSLYVKKRYDGKIVLVTKEFEEIEDFGDIVEQELGFPCFIKPSNSGSSVGVCKAKSKEELMEKLQFATQYDRKIVVEKNINCIELETAVLGNDDIKVSAVGQIMPHGEFYTFESKYEDAESKTCIPALVDESIQKRIQALAVRAFKSVDGHGLSRVDFFLDKDTGNLYLNEINTLPGFTSISMYPQLWMHEGYTYSELLDELITLAFDR